MLRAREKEGKTDMRRNRKNSIRKERIIMLASSAFVLAALTMTGVYMNGENKASKDDGYTLDFATLEENADDKFEEIAQNNAVEKISESDSIVLEDDLDYMPIEVDSGQIEIPGLTKYQEIDSGAPDGVNDTLLSQADETLLKEEGTGIKAEGPENSLPEIENVDAEAVTTDTAVTDTEAVSGNSVAELILNFSEENGMLRPITGEVIMHYSMNSSIYFATLDQYKYNPAVILAAIQGSPVSACADGKVIEIRWDPQIGETVVIDLGNGYQATYGQLEDVTVSVDSYVKEGEVIAYVAAPTKYYSMEGTNLYFALDKEGAPVNPEGMFR